MNWNKHDDYYIASDAGCDFVVYKTTCYPPRPIPAAQRWTLEISGPWYICRTFPRLFDCYAAAERVLAAMPTL